MYTPEAYQNKDTNAIKAFIKANGFGILINTTQGKPWGTHIPLQLEKNEKGEDVLVGHIAKANPQWKSFTDNDVVLCIFNGPHSYISSSWYKEEEVPTWNYIAVHVYGKLTITSETATLEAMHRLVDNYERGSECPISTRDMSNSTLRQVEGVVGFSITITEMQATYKLSQTRKEDHAQIISELKKKDDPLSHSIASLIKENDL